MLGLGILAAICVLCCGAAVLGTVLLGKFGSDATKSLTSPQAGKAIAAKIADYDLPAGYKESGGLDMVYQMVVITSSSSRMSIILMQFPSGVSATEEEMERQMQSSLNQQQNNYTWTQVEERKVTIKGKEVTINVQEGTSTSSYYTMRREIGVFQGKQGLVMLMAMGDASDWDGASLDQFLASIR